ncbi:MAG: hypothetical protein OJF47_003262 [Nitrospira sp.]|jgi:hypothetical protein|nr:MAG: hypothetical protein OJF47_003262 [Nitrospira sp.]
MTMRSKAMVVTCGLLTLMQWLPLISFVSFGQTVENTMPFSTVGFQSGMIDEVQGTTIRIDGRSYVAKSDAQVIDHQGRPLDLDQIVPTSEVKFHLKEGRVDKMVVTLPQ